MAAKERSGARSGLFFAWTGILVGLALAAWNSLTLAAARGFLLRAFDATGVPPPAWLAIFNREGGFERDAYGAIGAGLLTALLCWMLRARIKSMRRAVREARKVVASAEGDAAQTEAGRVTDLVAPRQLDEMGTFFFFEVFDRAPLAMILLDSSGRVVRMNKAAEKITGREPEEVRREPYWDAFLDPAGRATASARFPRWDKTSRFEETWTMKSGETRRMGWVRSVFRDDNSEVSFVLHAAAGVEAAPASPIDFSLAEEFLNELTMIGVNGELVLSTLNPTDPIRPDVAEICRAAERATVAVNRLLAHKPQPSPPPPDPRRGTGTPPVPEIRPTSERRGGPSA